MVTWVTGRCPRSCRILDGKCQSARAFIIPGSRADPNTAEMFMGDLQQSSLKHRPRATTPQKPRRTLAHAAGAVIAVGALLLTASGYWMAHGMLSGITV